MYSLSYFHFSFFHCNLDINSRYDCAQPKIITVTAENPLRLDFRQHVEQKIEQTLCSGALWRQIKQTSIVVLCERQKIKCFNRFKYPLLSTDVSEYTHSCTLAWGGGLWFFQSITLMWMTIKAVAAWLLFLVCVTFSGWLGWPVLQALWINKLVSRNKSETMNYEDNELWCTAKLTLK